MVILDADVLTTSVKKIVLGGCLTGLGSGLSWSVFEIFASRDGVFNGQEFALSLILPLLVRLAVGKGVGVQRRVLLPIAYLTLAMPVFGMGMGGENVLVMTTSGAIGGLFWTVPFWIGRDQVPRMFKTGCLVIIAIVIIIILAAVFL